MTIGNDIIFAICLLTLAWLLWMEFRRRDRSYRVVRMLATTLAVAALICILLPLTYEHRPSFEGGRSGVLLTEGYVPDSLRTWINAHPEQEMVNWDDATALPTFGSLSGPGSSAAPGSLREFDTLHVFGYGLTKEQWAELHPAGACPSLVLHPSPAPIGVMTVDWQRRLLPGQRLQVQGSLAFPPGAAQTANPTTPANPAASANPGAGASANPAAVSANSAVASAPAAALKLLLTGMGTVLDSTTITAKATSETGLPADCLKFQLETIPAPIGPVLYHLLVLDGKDTVERDDIPAEVLPGKALKVLLLAASPGWENTFLLKWLTRNGQGVAARTAVSRAKYDIAFVNIPEWPLDHLSASLLSHFDIVVANATVLSALGKGELSVLLREISDLGLGLIIPVDSAGKIGIGAGMPPLAEAIATKDSSRGLYIRDRPGLQPLFRDSLSRIQVAAALYGKGRVLFTTRNATWSQALAGEEKAYASYWSELLHTAARKKETADAWSMEPNLPVVGEPVHARLQTTLTRSSQSPQPSQFSQSPQTSLPSPRGYFTSEYPGGQRGQSDPQSVYLAQDPNLPFNWQGIYWPEKAGWQYTYTGQGDTSHWYVWPVAAWRGIRRQQRWEETQEYIADQRNGTSHPQATAYASANTAKSASATAPLPKGWFFVIFLLSLGFLWAERKMEWMSGRIVR